MNDSMLRRDLLRAGAQLGIASSVVAGMSAPVAYANTPGSAPTALWSGFPRLDTKQVYEVVLCAHSNAAKVKELVKACPPLVNAWWDWGFGDWESPLGAASHTGQRGIAEFLLEHGSRIDIFAATMLGMTDVVKAFVAAQPGVQRTLGPHGITLLAHARVGKDRATATLAYLESLGDADQGLKAAPLSADRKQIYVGKFASAETDVKLEIRLNRQGQLVADVQSGKEAPVPRWIHFRGNDEFFPAGSPSFRFRFTVRDGKANAVTLAGATPLLTAARVGP